MSTKIVLNGEVYVLRESWIFIWNQLDHDEERWVEMMKEGGKMEVIKNSDEFPNTSLGKMIDIIELGTTSSQMDGWDSEEDEEEDLEDELLDIDEE